VFTDEACEKCRFLTKSGVDAVLLAMAIGVDQIIMQN